MCGQAITEEDGPPMAVPESALSERLEAFRVETAAAWFAIRSASRCRSGSSSKRPNGSAPHRISTPRTSHRTQRSPTACLTTNAYDVELRIPKLRRGSYFPIILELLPRTD